MTRRKRKDHTDASGPYNNRTALRNGLLGGEAGARPSVSNAENNSRWEVEMDRQGRAVRGVRIYLPKEQVEMRAYLPIPISLHNQETCRKADRWINPVFDAHYTMRVWGLWLRRTQPKPAGTGLKQAREVRDDPESAIRFTDTHSEDNALNRVLPDGTLSDLMADTQAAIETAYTLAMNAVGEMAASVLEPFPVLGDDQIPQYTNRLEFTAAVSSAEDRRFLSLLIHADALMIRAEGLYLAGLIDAEILGDVSVNMDAILETCATEVTRVIHQMAIAFTRRNRHERLF